MEAIASKLEVTRPVVYSCYSNRTEVLAALLKREEQTLVASVLDAYPVPGRYPSTQGAYIGGMQALLRAVSEHPDTWRTLFYCNPGPDVAELFARGRRRVAEQFALLVRPDLERWGIAEIDRKTPVLVDLFVSMGESAVRSLLDSGNTYGADELGEIVGAAAYAAMRTA